MRDPYTPSRPPRTPSTKCVICGREALLIFPHDDGPRCIDCTLDGPSCSKCGSVEQPYVVADGDRRCVACLDRVPPDGVVLVGRLPWDDDDNGWFDRHPHRRLRLRPPFCGELFMLGWADARERTAAAERAGRTVSILVEVLDGEFVRAPGDFLGDDLSLPTDADIQRLLRRETVH
jgi:hypothetical protein